MLDDLRTAARAETHFVAIGRGQRREPRLENADLVLVDGNALTRRTLLKAVAIAADRAKQPDRKGLPGDAKAALTPLSREEAHRRGSLILVAEDNEINQKVILQQLTLLGQTADIASNGREALERWQSGDYATLFADLHMPEMDGYELTAAIRTAETSASETRKPRIPIIAFTANALKGEAERCIAIGMDDYLTLTDTGMIAEANLTSATLLGAERTKLLQRRFDNFVATEYRDHWHRLFMSVMKDASAAVSLVLQRKDGSRFNAHLDCRRMAEGQAKPVLCIAITDLSERELDERVSPTPTVGATSRSRGDNGNRDPGSSPGQALEVAPTTAPTSAPVDVNVLKALIGDDEAMIRDFLHDFRLSAAKIAVELRTACAESQATIAGALAHKLKSSARSVGALVLGELCAAMEKAGKAGDAETLAALLPRFEQELAGVECFLERY